MICQSSKRPANVCGERIGEEYLCVYSFRGDEEDPAVNATFTKLYLETLPHRK